MSTTAMSEPKRIYLDHAAAPPLSARAAAAMAEAHELFGNPSSLHREGRAAAQLLAESRARIAKIVGATPGGILFTGSGSESDALAILGVARAYQARGKHIVVSAIEHKAVLKSAQMLAQEGFEITTIKPDSLGRVDPAHVAAAVRDDTTLVSLMYANNEIGTVEPIADLAALLCARGSKRPLFHTDACQAAGQLPLDVSALGVDLMSINAAKAYGPKGVGALYARRGVALAPLIPGEQQQGLRGGTESVALAAGFAAALDEAEEMRAQEVPRLTKLRDLLLKEIKDEVPEIVLNGDPIHRLANNVHVSVPGIEGESILLMLDEAGIACATGSACNSLDLEPSHVLLATGGEAALAHGSIRFSLGRSNTEDEMRRTAREFGRIVRTLTSFSALTIPALRV
jgi:cysteine desulfurase